MYAIILAGGRGERLRPLTNTTPKPMIRICGRPILEHQISSLKRAGVTDVLIAESYLTEVIQKYFGNGEKFGIKIQHLVLGQELGSAGAIRKAIENIPEKEKDTLLIYGDVISDFDLGKAVAEHREKPSSALASMLTVEPHFLPEGVVIINDKGLLEKIIQEKEAYSVNSAILVLNREILPYIPERGDFSKDVLEPLSKIRVLYWQRPEGYWGHITDISSLRQVREDAENGRIKLPTMETVRSGTEKL